MRTGNELDTREELKRCCLSMFGAWPGNPALIRFFYWFYLDKPNTKKDSEDKQRSYSFYLAESPDHLNPLKVTRVLLDSMTKHILEKNDLSVEEIAQRLSARGITLVQADIHQQISHEINFVSLPEEVQNKLGLSSGNPTPDEIAGVCASSPDKLINYAPLMALHLTGLCIKHNCQGYVDPYGNFIFGPELAQKVE